MSAKVRSHIIKCTSKLESEIFESKNERFICAGDVDDDTLHSPISVSYHLELHVAI